MLAAEALPGQVTYPKMISAKLNGVRGLKMHGRMMARSLKEIPNPYVQSMFADPALDGMDGELVIGDFSSPEVFPISSGGCMRKVNTPVDCRFYVFDIWDRPELSFQERVEVLRQRVAAANHPRVVLVPQALVKSDAEADAFMKDAVAQGYEGAVMRRPAGVYKYGRSTEEEGGFLRLTPWYTMEGVIQSIVEKQANTNEAKINELGDLKRSSHKAGFVPLGTAGAMVLKLGNHFLVGPDQELAVTVAGTDLCNWYWQNRENVVGRIVRIRFKQPVKEMGLPRFGQLEGFRDPIDMSV
jgi:DNA ligase-1